MVNFFNSETSLHIPIIGHPGSGKTSLIMSLGLFLSSKGWGRVHDLSQQYYNQILPDVLRGRGIPPTDAGTNRGIILQVDYPHQFTLSSGDLSGHDLIAAIEQLSRFQPGYKPGRLPAEVMPFANVIQDASGLIVLVDVAGEMLGETYLSPEDNGFYGDDEDEIPTSNQMETDNEPLDKQEAVFNAFANQLQTISNGVLKILEMRGTRGIFRRKHKLQRIWFVFTKEDIHGLRLDQIRKSFDAAFSVLLASLNNRDIETSLHTCINVGHGSPMDRVDSSGVEPLFNSIIDFIRPLGKIKTS